MTTNYVPGTKIAVAKISDIVYDDIDHGNIDHIGCTYPGTDPHVGACGYRNASEPFDYTPLEDTPDQYICLGCIVATQHVDDGWCWKTGLKCVCGFESVEIAI